MKCTWMLLLVLTAHSYCFIQQSHLSNDWYPHNPVALRSLLKECNQQATQHYKATVNPSLIRSIIVPHAGYNYSGNIAAAVYRLLDKQSVKKLIFLAPDHFTGFDGVALPQFQRYQTPLGVLNVDVPAVKKLALNKLFHYQSAAFNREHSLEVQLPFIQYFLDNNSRILPLIIGKISCDQANVIAKELKPLIDKNTLVIATTDFTHYGKNFNFIPFKDFISLRIRALDSAVVELIEQGECNTFDHFLNSSQATICGHYPLNILLSLIQTGVFGSVESRFIAYDRSNKQENNNENSVSYCGILFTQEKLEDLPIEDQLTQQEQRFLWQEADSVLKNIYDQIIPIELLYPIKSFGITQAHGAFATLEVAKTKELRGCIGRITTSDPLYKTTAIVTRDTALHDSRFKPVEKNELPSLSLKLSVLSEPKPIKSYKEIIIGKHGVILHMDNKSAVFLPEVPTEFGWNLEKMLTELSKKAGLRANAWQDKDAQFLVFTSLDIKEGI